MTSLERLTFSIKSETRSTNPDEKDETLHTTHFFKHCLIAALLILHHLPGEASADPVDIFDEVLEMHRGGRVHLKNASGNIDIETWSQDKISIKARILPSDKNPTEKIAIDIKESKHPLLFASPLGASMDRWALGIKSCKS